MMDWASDNLEDILPLEELGDDMQIDMDMQFHADPLLLTVYRQESGGPERSCRT